MQVVDLSGGSQSVDQSRLSQFYSSLELQSGHHKAERIGSLSMVMVDVDIRYQEVPGEGVVDSSVGEISQMLTGNLFKLVEDLESVQVCVFRKPARVNKDGFHLMVPSVFMLNKSVLQILEFLKTDVQVLNNNNITFEVDVQASKEGKYWILYGGRKPDGVAYELAETIKYVKNYTGGRYTPIVVNNDELHVSDLTFDTSHDNLTKLIRTFSVNPFGRPIKRVVSTYDYVEVRDIVQEESTVGGVVGVEQWMTYVKLVNVNRLRDYHDWRDLCFVTKSCLGNSGLQEFINLSKGMYHGVDLDAEGKFDMSACLRLWTTASSTGGKTIGTLKYYAKLDSPALYTAIKRDTSSNLLKEFANVGYGDLRSLIMYYEAVQDTTFAYDGVGKDWYMYSNGLWVEGTKESVDLKTSMAQWLRKEINVELMFLLKKIAGAKDEAFELKSQVWEILQQKKDQLGQLLSDVYDIVTSRMSEGQEPEQAYNYILGLLARWFLGICHDKYPTRMVGETAQSVFLKPKEYIDSFGKCINLMSFENGVFDDSNGEIREPSAEDKLVIRAPSSYLPKIYQQPSLVSNMELAKVQDFFKKIFPDKEICEFFINVLATSMVGLNKRREAYFMTGTGANGKSVLKRLIQDTFGEYVKDISNEVIVGNVMKSGKPVPDLSDACTKGSRFAFTQETKISDKINPGAFKEITGGDSFHVRTLYKSGGTVTPQFTLYIICNDLPRIEEESNAIWDRVVIIPFVSEFLKKEDYDKKKNKANVYIRDNDLQSTIGNLRSVLFTMLLTRYITLKNANMVNTFPLPDVLKKRRDAYKDIQSVFTRFFTRNYVRMTNVEEAQYPNHKISLDDIVSHYDSWSTIPSNHASKKSRDYIKNCLLSIIDTKLEDDVITGYRRADSRQYNPSL